MRNHTATHLLHESLRQHLGRHVHQAGSLVSPDRLRFDFTYEAALEPKQIRAITDTVNQAILAGYQLDIEHKPYRQALAEGATALFGEKYGDVVRTIALGDCDVFCSYELCGGTHVQNTCQIGSFLIAGEGSAAAGVRRIEALTGMGAESYAQRRLEILDHAARSLNVPAEEVEARVEDLKGPDQSSLDARSHQIRQQLLARQAQTLADQAQDVAGLHVLAARVDAADVNGMRIMADDLRNKLGSGIVVLGAVLNGRPTLIAAATTDVVAARGERRGAGASARPHHRRQRRRLAGHGPGRRQGCQQAG